MSSNPFQIEYSNQNIKFGLIYWILKGNLNFFYYGKEQKYPLRIDQTHSQRGNSYLNKGKIVNSTFLKYY